MRIRTIKPEFLLHEGLCNLSEFSRLLAIVVFAADTFSNPNPMNGETAPASEWGGCH